MPGAQAVQEWGAATWGATTAGVFGWLGFMPNVLGAVLVLLVGWGVGVALSTLTERGLEALRFDRALRQTGIHAAIARAGVALEPSDLVAALVRWTVWLVAFMAAADTLRLPQVSAGIASLIAYVPNVVAAIALLTFGLLFATVAERLVRGATAGLLAGTGDVAADVAYWVVAGFAVLAAIGQLNIAPALVQTLYTAIIAAVALAAAIAFGFGLRGQARDVVAGRAVAEQFHPGDEVALEATRGRIQRVGLLTTMLQTSDGLVSVPNHLLVEGLLRVGGSSVRLAPAGGGGGPRSTPSQGESQAPRRSEAPRGQALPGREEEAP
ncbi:MAG: mechanosensitive ion channel domain-containing protein [Candidatus Sericytochromatia bacterium]|nr:mechanosensitive ion channel domain-containing protein [Candidatus Sericytochromatia bacterium]